MATTKTALAEVEAPNGIVLLSRRLKAGEEEAWREFHAAYCPRLLRYLLVVTRGQEEAARDAMQAAFVRAARYMRRFETEAALWSWLTVLARSAVLDEHRKRGRYLAFLERWFTWHRTVGTAEVRNSANDRLEEFLAVSLDALTPEEQQIVERKYVDDLSVREIAGELGDTEKAVESRLGRIRRKLKDAIIAQLRHEP